MWRSEEWEERCRKHFEHKLSKGVCPYCLREKLIHLSASSSASTTANASSSSYSSPTYSSGCCGATPPHEKHKFSNNSQQLFKENMVTKSEATKKTARSFSLDIKENKEEEKKQGREEENKENKEKKKKKRWFWAKLLHSKTMKEKGSTKWLFY